MKGSKLLHNLNRVIELTAMAVAKEKYIQLPYYIHAYERALGRLCIINIYRNYPSKNGHIAAISGNQLTYYIVISKV